MQRCAMRVRPPRCSMHAHGSPGNDSGHAREARDIDMRTDHEAARSL
ncbi:Hypothetical protein A7982_07038 [Minicystis rosea]|nr:Hypothetical protein A7982_07038 [Minicystis rosea]